MAGLPWLKVYSDLPRDPRSLILGDILGDPRAWTYVVQFRMYLADKAPVGRLSGAFAPAAFERCAGWAGEKGALLQAMRDAGFVRVGPARDGEGTEIEDLDWAREQGAHVAKVERDAKKPRGNSHTVVSPSRDIGGTDAGTERAPRGESRELRIESRDERSPASQEPAVPPREALALQPPTPKRKKTPTDKPTDPRHAPLVKALAETGHVFLREDFRHVAELLRLASQGGDTGGDAAVPEVLRRWAIGRAWRWANGDAPCQSLRRLVACWNECKSEETAPPARVLRPSRGPAPPSNFDEPTPIPHFSWLDPPP